MILGMPGEAGTLIAGRYRLVEPAGRVWHARDELLGRDVAAEELPLPPLPPADRVRPLDQALDEARAAARLDHPGIVTVHDVIDDAGTPWIITRLAPGRTLGAETARLGRLPWRQVASLGQQVADALAYAHAAGAVHRDLTPDDILLTGPAKDRAVITGFGRAGAAPAPRFLAPEQLGDAEAGPPADLWALGAILYAAAEGHPPFDGSTQAATVTAILTKPPAPPAHAGPLAGVLEILLSKDPAARPDAGTAAADLARLQHAPLPPPATSTLPAPPAPPAPLVPLSAPATDTRPGGLAGLTTASGRPRLLVGAITGIAMVAILVLVVTLFSSGHARSPAALSGTLAGTLADPSGSLSRGVAFSPDGKTIAGSFTPSRQGPGHVDVWTAAAGHPAAVLASPPGANGTSGLAFDPQDGTALAVGSGAGVSLWNLTTRQARTLPAPGHAGVRGVAFAPDGATVAALSGSGDVGRLTVATGDWLTGQFTTTQDGAASTTRAGQVAYSSDGTLLAAADGSGTVRVWKVSGGASPAVVTGAAAAPLSQAVAFSPDGKTLAVIAAGGRVRLWDIATKTFTTTLAGAGNAPQAVAYSPNGATLAVADGNGQVYLWNLAKSQATSITTPLTAGPGVTGLAFSPDGTVLAASSDQSARVYLYRVTYAGT